MFNIQFIKEQSSMISSTPYFNASHLCEEVPALKFASFPSFHPCLSTGIYNIHKKRKTQSQNQNFNFGKGKWTDKEQNSYISFLKTNMLQMVDKLLRKSRKVFLNMSNTIQTRTADQCRSHHQKLIFYHSTVQGIINHYQGDVFKLKYSGQDAKQKRNAIELNTFMDDANQNEKKQRPFYSIKNNGNDLTICIMTQEMLSY